MVDENELYRARAQLTNAVGIFLEQGYSMVDIVSEVENEVENQEEG